MVMSFTLRVVKCKEARFPKLSVFSVLQLPTERYLLIRFFMHYSFTKKLVHSTGDINLERCGIRVLLMRR